MSSVVPTFEPIAPRPSPRRTNGLLPWLRTNLFGSPGNMVSTLLVLALAVWWLPGLVQWAVTAAIVAPDADKCQAARGVGACWGVITEKWRLIIFGRYPFDEQWRPEVATLAMVALLVASCVRTFWKPWLVLLWIAVLALFFTLMGGGVLGLEEVDTDRWGGLPLTIMLPRCPSCWPSRCPSWWRWADAATCPRSAPCARSTWS